MDQQGARTALGQNVRTERVARGMTVEAAAKAGGIGHMTWRKLERGGSVFEQTYAAADRAFGWRQGTTLNAARTDGQIPDDAAAPDTSNTTTPPVWADKHGRTRALRHPTPSEQQSPTDQALDLAESMSIAELRHISAMYTRRADSITAELDAIQKKLSELTRDTSQHAEVRRACEQHPELTDAYQQYLEASVAVAELRTEVHQQQTRPIGEINTQELAHRADQACAAIRSTYEHITKDLDTTTNQER